MGDQQFYPPIIHVAVPATARIDERHYAALSEVCQRVARMDVSLVLTMRDSLRDWEPEDQAMMLGALTVPEPPGNDKRPRLKLHPPGKAG